MQRKKPRPASVDDVKISRDREYAVIDYADEAIGGMQLHVGPEIANMSDHDILGLHNEVVAAMQASADEWEDVVIEIPVGKEPLAFHPDADQWSPRGNVVRCVIEDDESRMFHQGMAPGDFGDPWARMTLMAVVGRPAPVGRVTVVLAVR